MNSCGGKSNHIFLEHGLKLNVARAWCIESYLCKLAELAYLLMRSLWMFIAGFLFSCMGTLVKLGAADFSSIELVFYRSLFGLLVIYALVRIQRLPLLTVHWKSHCWRGFSGLGALLMFFFCIAQLPLATAVTLNYTSPLFLALFTTVILKEHFHRLLVVTVVLGFVGVILLLRGSRQLSWPVGVNYLGR